jgi:hypothetical protein
MINQESNRAVTGQFKRQGKRVTIDGRTYDDDPTDPFRVTDGHAQRHCTAHTMTDQRGAANTQLLHKLINQADEVGDVIRISLFARLTKPPKI